MEAEADTYIKYLPHHLYRWYKFKNDWYINHRIKRLWEQSVGYLMRNGLQADNNTIDDFTERGTELNIEVI